MGGIIGDVIGSVGGFLKDDIGLSFTGILESLGIGGTGGIPASIASAGIFSAASLLSSMFGQDLDEEQLNFAKDQFEQNLVLSREKLAQDKELSVMEMAARERMAGAAAGATVRAAGISAGAQKQIATQRNKVDIGQTRVGAKDKAADRQVDSLKGRPELIMAGRTGQANAARATGQEGRMAMEAIMNGIARSLR